MEKSPDIEQEMVVESDTVEMDMSGLSDASLAFSESISTFNKVTYVDKRQRSGRWAPAFPEASLERQEEYVERMIARDKELNRG